MRRVSVLAMSCALCAAGIPAHGEEPVVSLGKRHAARSAVEWNVRDIDHPQLGAIRYAVQRIAVATPVQNDRVLSQSFVSCQKGSGKVAIELVNSSQSDLAGGLRPTEMPRLLCSRPDPGGGGSVVTGELAAKWEIGRLGDTLARDLSPSELRRCIWIEVLQSVALPAQAASRSQRIAMEIAPYDAALDSVFAACGERTAFAALEQAPAAVPPAARTKPAPQSAPIAPSAASAWKPARTTARGRTNVRASANLDSPVVTMLDPGTKVLAQRASAPWWEVKPRSGEGFRGYIRQDRLTFE